MACFVAPAAVAIVTTVVQKVVQRKEETAVGEPAENTRGKWTRRLRWLNTMLWGGTVLLAFEHAWHGELVPWPPFLTAMQTPETVGPMLREIATLGVALTAVIIVAWGIMVGFAEIAERRAKATDRSAAEAKDVVEGA